HGKLLRQQHAGQRWINQVALDGDVVRAVCTMPAGKAGDNSELFRLTADGVAADRINWRRTSYAEGYFHYGDHSNHVSRRLTRKAPNTIAINGDQVHWFGVGKDSVSRSFPLDEAAVPVAGAVDEIGGVVVGTTAAPSKQGPTPANLHVL